MPRPAKGARLWLHPTERTWIIRDRGEVFRRTGCSEGERERAEEAFGQYLGEKFKPAARGSDLTRISVAEVMTAYAREHAPHTKGLTPRTIGYTISALLPYWGGKMLSEIRGASCREYAERRGATVSDGTIRQELATLSAAIRHWHREHGPLTSVPAVTLPQKPASRNRWLTRSEAARLLAGALGWYRETWCDVATRKVHQRWRRYRKGINRHLARFILLGLYTGTRGGAIKALQWMPNTSGGWIDFQRGVFYRRGEGEVETKKRRPPVRIGNRLLAHLRRWKRLDDEARALAAEEASARGDAAPVVFLHVVAWKGGGVETLRNTWKKALHLAELDRDVTPHVLRHTRATWMMQQGVEPWEASGALGMSIKMLEDVYGHHHPDWQKRAAEV